MSLKNKYLNCSKEGVSTYNVTKKHNNTKNNVFRGEEIVFFKLIKKNSPK